MNQSEARVESRIDTLSDKFDVMGRDVSDARERPARIEGYLMGPKSFSPRPPSPPPTEPDDERQAG